MTEKSLATTGYDTIPIVTTIIGGTMRNTTTPSSTPSRWRDPLVWAFALATVVILSGCAGKPRVDEQAIQRTWCANYDTTVKRFFDLPCEHEGADHVN